MFLVLAIASPLFVPVSAAAASVTLGDISFNTLIPGGPNSPGVNEFQIDNLTGTFAIPPNFPASSNIIFESASLTLTFQGGAIQFISLGNLASGSSTPNNSQFSATQKFTSALFSATLSGTIFTLSDGSSFKATSSQISVLLTPSGTDFLVPDVDFALITVSEDFTTVPEARSILLLPLGVCFVFFASRSKSIPR